MVRRAMLGGHAGASVQDAFTWARAAIERDYPQRLPVMVDQTKRPLWLHPKPASASGAEDRPAQQPPAPPPCPEDRSSEPAPAPAPCGPGAEPSPGCTRMLAVTLCSQRTSAGTGGPGTGEGHVTRR